MMWVDVDKLWVIWFKLFGNEKFFLDSDFDFSGKFGEVGEWLWVCYDCDFEIGFDIMKDSGRVDRVLVIVSV